MSSTKKAKELEQEMMKDEEYRKLLFQNWQLSRLAWSLTKLLGGRVTLNTEEIPMLWNLKVGRDDPKSKETTFISEELPELDEALILDIVDQLVGTKNDLREAMVQRNIKQYPIQYLGMRLSRHIQYSQDGDWVTLAEAEKFRAAQAEKN